jgi:predicted DNA-binding transcriptional regulator AlpA
MPAAVKKSSADDHSIGVLECAALLGVHPVTVYKTLVKKSDFPKAYRIAGNKLSWPASEILAWREAQRGRPHSSRTKGKRA